jgi:3-deoxy-D-manno-octulosonic-acid transferase
MLLWIYRVLFPVLLLLSSPYYLWRMRRRRGYSENFGNRFGAGRSFPPKEPGYRRVWLQAVSVGEMLAVGPVIDALAKEQGIELYLTTTTSTGYRLAQERYGSKVIGIEYFPLDWCLFSARTWRRVDPDLVVLAEGERWPEHLAQARRRRVPVVCINARLSDRSYRRMRGVRPLLRPMFAGVTWLLPTSEFDAQRFRELGFPAERMTVTGNIKLDVTLPLLSEEEKGALREQLGLGGGDPVILGSSTWPGEEAALVAAWRTIRASGKVCRLLLVPRHAERRDEVEGLLRAEGVRYHLRSRGGACEEVEVAVADTTGELRALTQIADVVFVGKSLPPHTEGQTPVEAAALGKALVLGPSLSNFRAIVGELVSEGAARQVNGADELGPALAALLGSPADRAALGSAARTWQQRNQGAVQRTVTLIRSEILRGKN